MTLIEKIKNLTWWNSDAKLKDILLQFVSIFIEDAPKNSNQYARQNGGWSQVVASQESGIDTAFVEKPYLATMLVAYDSTKPNFEIHLTGNLNLTLIGTENGSSGIVNLYFSGTEVATLNGFESLEITGAGEMIPVYFIHDSDGLKWYDDNSATIDTSTLALQDGTILYHTAVATSTGTFSNVGNICTGIGTSITSNMIGAKIIKSNGEIGIIATRTSDTEFTTVEAFPTNSTGISFVVKCIAYKINTDGSINIFDKTGALRSYIDVDGTTSNNYLNVQTNGNIAIGGFQINLQDTVFLNGFGFVRAPMFQNRIIYTVATLPNPADYGYGAGIYASVSDALTPTHLGLAVGGGAVTCPVYFNGTNWVTI